MLSIKKIMLLDDDLEIHQFVSDVLHSFPEQTYELVSYHEYDLALAQLEDNAFDLCLVDYIFHDSTDRTGIDFIREAVARYPYLPCILFTGSGSQITELQGIEVGAVDYIDKGNTRPQTFIRAVRYALKRASTLKELYALYQQTLITSQFRSEMMRLASHDLKTPLSTIMLSLDILMRQGELNANPVFSKHMERIQVAATRIQMIADEVLTLEELNMDDFEPTDITMLIESVIRELTIQGELQSKQLIFAPKPHLPEVLAIPGQIREVLHNLVSNAIKYTSHDGLIKIQTETQSDVVSVAIIDNGYGIEAEEHVNLFKPFYRIITDETKDISGSGLGLYLVKQIIERHRGNVYFESVRGEGSTFRFLLPRVG